MANEGEGSGEMLEDVLEEARKLVKTELAVATRELKDAAQESMRSALLAGGAGAVGLCGLTALAVGLGQKLSGEPARGATFVGAALCAVAGGLGLLGAHALPDMHGAGRRIARYVWISKEAQA